MVLKFSANDKLKNKSRGNINFISIFSGEKLQKPIAMIVENLGLGYKY